MGRTFDKTVIDLKLPAHRNFSLLYLGARAKISKHITKSTLFSMLVESAWTEKPAALFSDTAQAYTFAELIREGKTMLEDIFAALEKMDDVFFYRKMDAFCIGGDGEISDELLRHTALQILNDGLSGVNLRDTDIENIVNVILVSEEALRSQPKYEAHKDQAAYEAYEENEDSDSFVFLKDKQPCSFYKEVRAVIWRYRRLQRAESVYVRLFSLFKQLLDGAMNDMGFGCEEMGDYYDAFDGNILFYAGSAPKAFGGFRAWLNRADLSHYMDEGALKELRSDYTKMLQDKGEMEAHRHCGAAGGGHCSVCIFDLRKCADKWMKRHMERYVERLCFVDSFTHLRLPTFEEVLFSRAYPHMYAFKRKA